MQCTSVPITIVFLAACSTSTLANDMTNHVAEAKKLTATSLGLKYDELLGSYIGETMRICIPPGSTSSKNLGSFTYVSRVGASGNQINVAVEPSTDISECFKSKFEKIILSPPPDYQARKPGLSGYPIAVEIKVAP